MKKDNISDQELLALIHKNIDIKKLKEHDKTITKKRLDKLFQGIRSQLKRDELLISTEKEENDGSNNRKFNTLIVNVDGASRGNPGKAGIGVAIFDKDSNMVEEAYENIGVSTNNIAEYKALILGIKKAVKYSAKETLFKTDSELMAKQIMGEYKVKSLHLMYLSTEAQSLLKRLPKWRIEHIPREENKKADKLANKGIEIANKK